MTITIGGFEYGHITDVEQWPSFCEWHEHEYGFSPVAINDRLDSKSKELLEAYIAGAYWQYQQTVAVMEAKAATG